MDELHRAADKLRRELDILDQMKHPIRAMSPDEMALVVAQTKRVRNASTVLVRVAAQGRDQLQP